MRPSESITSTIRSNRSFGRQSEDYIDTYLVVPPDKGWGWMVVAASFLCNFVADGAMYTFGIFLADISVTFETTPTKVAVANSLMTGFYFATGPISCALVNRLGFQITGFFGGILASMAFGFCTLTNTLAGFLIVFGVIGGCGFGLVFVPSIIAVGFYFEKWRALATSIAVTGSAAGIIGFPLIIDLALAGYSWQTKFQIISVICILLAFLALLYRPLKPTHVLTTKDKKIVQILSRLDSRESTSKEFGIFKRLYNRFHNIAHPTHGKLCTESTYLMFYPSGQSTSSVFLSSVREESESNFIGITSSKRTILTRSERLDKLSTVFEVENAKDGNYCKRCINCKCCRNCCGSHLRNRPMYRDDIFYGGSLFTLSREFGLTRVSQLSRAREADHTLSVSRVGAYKDEQIHCVCCPESMVRTLVTMLNCSILRSPAFLLLTFSGFFTVLGLYAPFIYLLQRANEVGISEKVADDFFTVLGASNILGRLLSGVISSFPKMKPLLISYISLLVCGVATICSCFTHSVEVHYLYSAVFGLTIACFASLKSPIVVDLLGLENLTNAFGILLLVQGVAAFAGVPLAGLVVQTANSFNAGFLFAGFCITISAILLIPIKYVHERTMRLSKA